MARAHLVQVDFFNFLLKDLEDWGVNTRGLLKASELHRFDLEKPQNYVPVSCMCSLFESIETKEGITDFLSSFSKSIHPQNLGSYGDLFLTASDLLGAADLAVKYAPLTYTSEIDGLEINGPTTRFWIKIGDRDCRGRDHAAELLIGLCIRHIQLACRESWWPLEIHVPFSREPDLESYLPSDHNTLIRLNQPEIALVYATSVLSARLAAPSEFTLEELEKDLTLRKKICMALDSSQPGYIPTLAHLSYLFNTSERTLQRQLQLEGTSFGEVVDQWRFAKALDALHDQNKPIKEISQSLGYLQVQNFHRAFQRWTQTTPMRYREAI